MITTAQAIEMASKKYEATPTNDKVETVNEDTEIINQEGHDKVETPKDDSTPVNSEESNGGQTDQEIETKADGSDELKAKADESKDKADDKNDNKQKHTDKEKRDYAYIREKNRRKKAEAELAELKQKFKYYDGLKPEHFKKEDGSLDPEKYINWKVNHERTADEINRRQSELNEINNRMLDEENERRLNLCFSGQDADDYNKLLESNGPAFMSSLNARAKAGDPRSGILMDYLNGEERYPIILKRLMTDMDGLRNLFSAKNPYMFTRKLEEFAAETLRMHDEPKDSPKVNATLPITGRQTSSNPAKAEPQVRDRNYWNNYLRNHPRG